MQDRQEKKKKHLLKLKAYIFDFRINDLIQRMPRNDLMSSFLVLVEQFQNLVCVRRSLCCTWWTQMNKTRTVYGDDLADVIHTINNECSVTWSFSSPVSRRNLTMINFQKGNVEKVLKFLHALLFHYIGQHSQKNTIPIIFAFVKNLRLNIEKILPLYW